MSGKDSDLQQLVKRTEEQLVKIHSALKRSLIDRKKLVQSNQTLQLQLNKQININVQGSQHNETRHDDVFDLNQQINDLQNDLKKAKHENRNIKSEQVEQLGLIQEENKKLNWERDEDNKHVEEQNELITKYEEMISELKIKNQK